MNSMKDLLVTLMGFALFGLYILWAIGGIYWLWMSIQLGSFMMFILGIFPLTAALLAPVGAWSFLFGVPDWVFSMFG